MTTTPPPLIWRLSRLILALGALAALLALLPDSPWWLGLLDPFRLHLGIALAFGALGAAVARRWLPAGLGLALAAAHLLTLGNLGDPEPAPSDQPRLSVLTFNFLGGNDAFDELRRYVESSQPDVIVLLEVRPALAASIRQWSDYPSQLIEAREDNFGVALLSRWPLIPSEIRSFGDGPPAVIGATDLGGRPLALVGLHPPPPVNSEISGDRDLILERVGDFLTEELGHFLGAMAPEGSTPHVVVVGDFNATPWMAPVKRLMARAGLRDSRPGFGYHSTWPSALGPLGIPIDLSLVSSGLVVVDRQVGPALGSDHRPVTLIIAPRP